MNSFNVKKWFKKLKLFIETDIQVIYFLEETSFNKKKINKSIKNNGDKILEIEKIILQSPTNLKESQSKAWEIKQNYNNKNPLNDLINKQIINIYNDFSGLTEDDQEKVLKQFGINILIKNLKVKQRKLKKKEIIIKIQNSFRQSNCFKIMSLIKNNIMK